MVFKGTLFLILLHYVVIQSGQAFSVYQRHHSRPHHSIVTDKAALLAFKQSISIDPNSKLANWNELTPGCNFTGVTCNKLHHRLSKLNLSDSGLVGFLSPFLSNLTRLRVLCLINNHFSGTIPQEFSSLRHLRYLILEGNNLTGHIPDSFSLLTSTTVINLRENKLTGTMPASLFSNCTSLKNVDLSMNNFFGKIPLEIGNCRSLWNLNLYNNQFTGDMPYPITNASQMYNLDLEYNHLTGELPSERVGNLPRLEFLHLSFTNMVSYNNNTNLDPSSLPLQIALF